MRTYWIYWNNSPIHCVRLPVGAADHDVKRKALDEVDVVPGVVCNYPDETPVEHRVKIHCGMVVPG